MLLAVMDLGSNSFKMTVAQWAPELSHKEPFRILHKERHPIQIGANVFQHGRLSPKDRKTAYRALRLMQQRLRDFASPVLRVVATSALRDAANASSFVEEIEDRLSLRIDVISGLEEARLIAQGLEWEYPHAQNALLIDIGGGSTELASFGSGWRSPYQESMDLGSLRLATHNGETETVDLPASIISIKEALNKLPKVPRKISSLVGSAGAVQSLSKLISDDGKSLMVMQLSQLERWITEHKNYSPSDFLNKYPLMPNRARVVLPGALILREALLHLNLQELSVTKMTLRDGVLLDLLHKWEIPSSGPFNPKELYRSASENKKSSYLAELESTAQDFHSDIELSHRLMYCGRHLIQSLRSQFKLDGNFEKLFFAALYLRDLGKCISKENYHIHSAYIVEHLNLSFLSTSEKSILSAVIRHHRKSETPESAIEKNFNKDKAGLIMKVISLLRLLLRLNKYAHKQLGNLSCQLKDDTFVIELHPQNLKGNSSSKRPLTHKAELFEKHFGLKSWVFICSTKNS